MLGPEETRRMNSRFVVLVVIFSKLLQYVSSDGSKKGSEVEFQYPRLPSFQHHLCLVNKPLLSGGDFNVSKYLLAPRIRKHKHLLLGVSSSKCLACCHQEEVLEQIGKVNSQQTDQQSVIPVGRIDCAEHHEWFPECETHPLPLLVYVSDKPERIVLRWSWPPEWVSEQVLNLKIPVRKLNTAKEVAAFLKNPGSQPRSLAILAVLPESHALYPEYWKLAIHNYWRLDTKFAIITDQALAETVKTSRPHLFHTDATLTISSVSPANNIFDTPKMSLFKKGRLDEWLNNTYLSRPIEEYTSWTARLVSTEAPLLLVFVNPDNNTQTELVRQLDVLAQKHLHKINFMSVDATSGARKLMDSFALSNCQLPCVSLRSGTLLGNKIFPLEASPVTDPNWVTELVRRFYKRELLDYSDYVHQNRRAVERIRRTLLNETEFAGSLAQILPTPPSSHSNSNRSSGSARLVVLVNTSSVTQCLSTHTGELLSRDTHSCQSPCSSILSVCPRVRGLWLFNWLNRLFTRYVEVTRHDLKIYVLDVLDVEREGMGGKGVREGVYLFGKAANGDSHREGWPGHGFGVVEEVPLEKFGREQLVEVAVAALVEIGYAERVEKDAVVDKCDRDFLPYGLGELLEKSGRDKSKKIQEVLLEGDL